MSIDFYKLPHAGIQSLVPYKPGKSIEELSKEKKLTNIIKMASNENPLGCSPFALAALNTMGSQQACTYPSPLHHPLMPKLADKLGISTEQLFLSNGSDFICSILLYCFALHTNKYIITHRYAFSTYAIQAHTLKIPIHTVEIDADWQVNTNNIIQACTSQTGLIFIANPNNPTGLLMNWQQIKHLLDNIPVSTLLVLDEAYYEFAKAYYPFNTLDWLNTYPNLVVLRTFSKIYGMAGLRLGYAIANPAIISLLQKTQLPFTVNQAALHAAYAAIDDAEFIQRSLQSNEQGMIQMRKAFDTLHLHYFPSACNFLTFDCKEDSMLLYDYLLDQGIIVRPLHAYKMNNYIRVTVGTDIQNLRFFSALTNYLTMKEEKE